VKKKLIKFPVIFINTLIDNNTCELKSQYAVKKRNLTQKINKRSFLLANRVTESFFYLMPQDYLPT